MNELKLKAEKPTKGHTTRKISQEEREYRNERLRNRLKPGIIVEDDLDPSDSIVNAFLQMVDENVPAWTPWESCPTWNQEIMAARPAKRTWLPDASGTIRETTLRRAPDAELPDSYRISLALQRRGLAAEIAGVMSCGAHEKIRVRLFSALTGDPGDTRYAPPSLDRIKDAGRRIWLTLAKSCKRGIRPAPGANTLPLDDAIDKVLESHEFGNRLMPHALFFRCFVC